ncbi:lactoylglutathione lyase [Sporomusaceae bacterium BoRhaA]|uniref:VOC family protein n=1 Tax=Pelorhabdus rhamnosifermentans TaxID=2772457 RepID=UPI001C0620FE|nr:VOC family protein [Pelorhabdus rhamnosifermentans]MBU2702902.1 lactoylglutathione lyase [Pelorhabdus rhamnosifermentans]
MYKVAHIGLVVKDADKSSSFYQQILNCEVVNSYQDERLKLIFLNSGGQIIELVQHLQGSTPEQRLAGVVDHIAFEVDDVSVEMERLRVAGVMPLSDKPWSLGRSLKNFFCLGPDGERLEFMQGTL